MTDLITELNEVLSSRPNPSGSMTDYLLQSKYFEAVSGRFVDRNAPKIRAALELQARVDAGVLQAFEAKFWEAVQLSGSRDFDHDVCKEVRDFRAMLKAAQQKEHGDEVTSKLTGVVPLDTPVAGNYVGPPSPPNNATSPAEEQGAKCDCHKHERQVCDICQGIIPANTVEGEAMNAAQKGRADALQARLQPILQALGVVDVKFFKGENWNETPMDARLDQVEVMVNAVENSALRIPVSADAVDALCAICKGRGYTDEGDSEIGSAIMDCDSCAVVAVEPDEGSLANEMNIQALNSQLDQMRNTVSRAINILEQVKIAIEEDDLDEALELINGALDNGEREKA